MENNLPTNLSECCSMLRMSEILGSNVLTDQVPFWSVKRVIVFIHIFCHLLPSSEVKTQKPFSMPTRKQGRYSQRDSAIAKDTKGVN